MKSKLFILIILFVLLIAEKPVAAQSQVDYPIYIIQSGDSLGYIAQLFGTTVEELIRVNSITNPDLVSPGQKLFIPGLDGVQGTLDILATQLGETLSDLAIEYRIDTDEIIILNKITSPAQLFVGSNLILPTNENLPKIVPIGFMGENETILEKSVALNNNPLTLSLINRKDGTSGFYSGSPIFDFPADSDSAVSLFAPKFPEVSISPLPLVQGSTVSIKVRSNHAVQLSGSLNEMPLHFFGDKAGEYYALQGIYAMATPGLVDFILSGTSEDGTTFSYSQQILLKPGYFDQDPPLLVDPKTIDPAVTQPEDELVNTLISKLTPVKHWDQIFKSPAFYQEYNSLFGTRRSYNNNPILTFHSGVDFGGGITLPIYAPANGMVVFAGPLTVRGNTIFIDHGWGVYSGFFHQNSLNVKVGDMVTQGQVIGEVGNTGRVNGSSDYYGAGAHLHWEVWVNGVQVDPLTWLDNEFPR